MNFNNAIVRHNHGFFLSFHPKISFRFFSLILFIFALPSLVQADEAGEPYRTIPYACQSFDFSPDGNLLLVVGPNNSVVYDIEADQIVSQINQGGRTAAFTPNVRQVLLGNPPQMIDSISGGYLRSYGDESATSVVFSPSFKYLAIPAGWSTCFVNLYDWETKTRLDNAILMETVPCHIEFTPDEKKFVAAVDRTLGFIGYMTDIDNRFNVYDIETKATRVFPETTNGLDNWGYTLIPRTTKLISYWGDRSFRIYDYETGALEETLDKTLLKEYWPMSLDIAPNGRYLLLGTSSARALVFDLETQQILRTFVCTQQGDIKAKYSPNGRTIAAQVTDFRSNNTYLKLWKIDDLYSPLEETPTAVPPLPTPTMTPTPQPQPVSSMLVPNVTAEFMSFYFANYPAVATDPRNGNLFFYMQLADDRQVIFGPVSPEQAPEDIQNAPVYAELPYRKDYYPKPYGFVIDQEGVLYIYLQGYIYRIPRQGVVETFYPKKQDDPYFLSLCMVEEGDNIPGVQPGDIVGMHYRMETSDYRDGYRVRLHALNQNGEVYANLGEMLIPEEAKVITRGPGRSLYLLCRGYSEEIDPTTGYYSGGYAVIYRFEPNGQFTKLLEFPSSYGDPETIGYWPKDDALYLNTYYLQESYWRSILWRIKPDDGTPYRIMNPYFMDLYILPSVDGENLYVMDRAVDRKYMDKYIESLTLNGPFPTPTGTYIPQPFPTQVPMGPTWTPTQTPTVTNTPTITPTPSNTFTPTNTPTLGPIPVGYDKLAPSLLYRDVGAVGSLAVHPGNGNLYYCRFNDLFSLPSDSMDRPLSDYQPIFKIPVYDSNVTGLSVDIKGNLFAWNYLDPTILFYRALADGSLSSTYTSINLGENDSDIIAIYPVKPGDRIPNTEEGDVLVLVRWWGNSNYQREILKFNSKTPQRRPATYMSSEDLKIDARDFCIGPQQSLYLLTDTRIYRLEADGSIEEYIHGIIPNGTDRFEYLAQDQAFYIHNWWSIQRLSANGRRYVKIGDVKAPYFGGDVIGSPQGNALYFLNERLGNTQYSSIQSLRYTGPTPYPAPTESPYVAPTPTPIKGWFVLDGFGGIHSTNPAISRPIMPYLPEFNIFRDLEPDPLGRGWYMLDGMGGIHTYPYDLPKPDGLPYFGFDIARSLEVTYKDGQLNFYLLDAFGVVHTTDPDFTYDRLPWFPGGNAQDLEPDTSGSGWLVIDNYGFVYGSDRDLVDLPMLQSAGWANLFRSMVRFPDDRTVLLDGFAGRHTNPFYKARDVMNGLPSDFYFPGFDIIWDTEIVPEKWN